MRSKRNNLDEIEGLRIKLRKLKLSDVDEIYKNLQNKEIVRWTREILWPYKKQDGIKWIRKTQYKLKNKKGYTLAIVLKTENKLIGIITLKEVNWKDKNAILGYWIGKNYWRKGFGTEAVKLILKFGFEKLKLHRIHASIFEENIASKRVLEKNGFKLEGIERESQYRYKKGHNVLDFSILKKEYEKQKK